MLKRLFCCASMLLLLLSGCSGGVETPPPSPTPSPVITHVPDQLPILMMVEGTLYQHAVGTLDPSIKIEDGQILGYITTEYANTVPTQNGEACGVPKGAPYARCPLPEHPEGMVAFMGYRWWIFLPESQVS